MKNFHISKFSLIIFTIGLFWICQGNCDFFGDQEREWDKELREQRDVYWKSKEAKLTKTKFEQEVERLRVSKPAPARSITTSPDPSVLAATTTLYERSSSTRVSEIKRFGFLSNQSGLTPTPDKNDWKRVHVTLFRLHPGPLIWDKFEKEECKTHSFQDRLKMVNDEHLEMLFTIWPFSSEAEQKSCDPLRTPLVNAIFFPDLPLFRYKYCKKEKYFSFLENVFRIALVQRNLIFEILNEPDRNPTISSEGPFFFQGSPEDYANILKDSNAYFKRKFSDSQTRPPILIAGMAGLSKGSKQFWKEVFRKIGKEDFDIGNIHSIDSHESHEGDFNVAGYKELIEESNPELKGKKIWVTEATINAINDQNFSRLLVINHVKAFAHGADKIFYAVYDLTNSGIGSEVIKKFNPTALIYDDRGINNPRFAAYEKMVRLLDGFVTVEQVDQREIYHFTFPTTLSAKEVYVAWGSGSFTLPTSINGQIAVGKITEGADVVQNPPVRTFSLTVEPIYIVISQHNNGPDSQNHAR